MWPLILLALTLAAIPATALDLDPATAIRALKETFQHENPPAFRFDLVEVPQARHSVELVRPETALPRSHRFPYDPIRALHAYAATCAATDRARVTGGSLAKALEWQRFVCGDRSALPRGFFETPPFVHPSGKSYARLALESGGEDLREPAWLARHVAYFHVAELKLAEIAKLVSSEQAMLAAMSPAQLESVANGEPIAWSERYVLLVERAPRVLEASVKYLVYPRAAWEKFLATTPFAVTESAPGTFCLLKEGNACWRYGKNVGETRVYRAIAWASLGMLAVIASLLFLQKLRTRRREAKAKLFVLQTLTHELRTPAAALSLGLEALRREFDGLPPAAQTAVLRLCDETQRLQRLVVASARYLQSDPIRFEPRDVVSLNEYLDSVLEPFRNDDVRFIRLAEDKGFRIDPYWLGLCVKNLVDNALRHGKSPVTVALTARRGRLRISVSDEGTLTDGQSMAAGLGLGLGIVRNVVRGMRGTLRLTTRPTTFSISLRGSA